MAKNSKVSKVFRKKSWQKWLRNFRNPTQKWPLLSSCVITLFLGWLVAMSFGVSPRDIWQDRLLTTTVTASTESMQFTSPKDRESRWSLPPGKFTIIGSEVAPYCRSDKLESECETDSNTRLVVNGAARLTFRSVAGGGWAISANDVDGAAIDVTVFDAGGEPIARSNQYLEFNAGTSTGSFRFPFVAEASVIGAGLHQSSIIDGTRDDFWQPILLSGNVSMIADNKPGREKYEVLTEPLDSGDVLHIGELPGDSATADRNAIWGVLSFVQSDNSPQQGAMSIDVVLHTSIRELAVTRFGAPEGHAIRASAWSIVHRWPNGQSLWIFLVSIVLITTFIFQIREVFAADRD